MRITAVSTLVLFFTISLFADSYARIRELRDSAKEAIASGSVNAERDIAPLITMLRNSHDDDDQRHLVDALVDMGRHDGGSPAAIKRYIIDNMTPILLALASNTKNSNFLRGDAILGLRNMGASREALQTVTEMALKDSDSYVKSRGEILENYIRSMPAGSTMKAVNPVDPNKEREALEFLKSREIGASSEQMIRSAMESKADEVSALLAAGVDVNAAEDDTTPLLSAIHGCNEGDEDAVVATLDVLLKAGADVKKLDDNKNTIMIHAAQSCGGKVIERLAAAGADVNKLNGSGVTPLMIALLSAKYDAAEALVAKGARLTKDQASVITNSVKDPHVKPIVAKATAAPAVKKK
jgi:hypothetical protein